MTVLPIPEVPFEGCPVCDDRSIVRMVPDWQRHVDLGEAIPIVGCGNPWHYANLDRDPRLSEVRQYVAGNLAAWDDNDSISVAIADIYQKVLNVIDTGHPLGKT